MCVTCAVVPGEQKSLAKSLPVEPSSLHSGAWAGAEVGWSQSQDKANRHREEGVHLRVTQDQDNTVIHI